MRHLPLRRAAFLAVLAAGLLGCEDAGTTVILAPTLTPGRWYLHSANGEGIPSLIGDRVIGLTQEETFIDSATIDVTAAGVYEQRIHLRILHAGVEDRQETFYDAGTWTREAVGFAFVSTLRSRTFSGTMQPGSALVTSETVLSWSGAPTIAGTYRKTLP
jgi:hypothetical protein